MRALYLKAERSTLWPTHVMSVVFVTGLVYPLGLQVRVYMGTVRMYV